MSPEQQRIAIAEACGWKRGCTGATQWVENPHGIRLGWSSLRDVADLVLPHYLNDLNAMSNAEDSLSMAQQAAYARLLSERLGQGWAIFANAAERAEAFLRTLNLWTGE